MRNFEKSTATRSRLAYGETDERRQRNDKLHKPTRPAKIWCNDRYDPNLAKRQDKRRIEEGRNAARQLNAW